MIKVVQGKACLDQNPTLYMAVFKACFWRAFLIECDEWYINGYQARSERTWRFLCLPVESVTAACNRSVALRNLVQCRAVTDTFKARIAFYGTTPAKRLSKNDFQASVESVEL